MTAQPPDPAAARWRRVEEICDTALRLSESERNAYLASACGEDDELRREVEALLSHERTANGFLSAAPEAAVAMRALSEARRDLTGSRLGDYEIVAKLGEGGMGVVYRARDHRLDRDVALKVVTRQNGADEFARLRSEARAAARLNHANICTVFEVAVTDGVACIAMEWIEGTPLSAAIPKGGWPADRVCRAGRQIAEALEHAHAHGITHRDLKSSNVMIRRDGNVKVIDFGIADRAVRPVDLTETQPPMARGMIGTLSYLAPELLKGDQPDARSDLWSLGVVLFEMTTGRLPFDGSSAPNIAAAILRDPPPPLPRAVAPGLSRVIERCLAKDPRERPAGAAEVALALNVANPGADVREGRRPNRIWAAGLAATVALAVAAYMWWPQNSTGAAVMRFENPAQVTTTTGVEEFAEWSPDGRMLAYSASTTGHLVDDWDIWVVQPGSGAPINRTEGFGGRNMFPSWSPNSDLISFWSSRDGGGCYVMPALAGAPRRVSPASMFDPNPVQWSPDGNELSCVVGTVEKPMLSLVSLDTGQERRRLALPGERRRMFVTTSPDQRRIAMVIADGGLDSDTSKLVVHDIETGTLQSLTDGRSKAWSPSWSSDGRSLYYVAQAGASMDLWEQPFTGDGTAAGPPRTITAGIGMRSAALSRDGRRLAYSIGRRIGNIYRVPFRQDKPATWAEAEQLTFDQASVQCFDLDRNGTRLAVSSDRSGSFDLWTMPSAGGNLMQLTSDPGAEWCPAWSPDGASLAFYSYRSGNRDVWTMPAGGGEWKQITTNEGSDLHPSWMFDGTSIAYLSGRNDATGVWESRLDGGPDVLLAPFFGGRLSPVDRRLAAFSGNGDITIHDLDGRQPAVLVQARSAGNSSWSSDGRYLIFRSAADQISSVDAKPRATSQVVADLSGRRGSVGIYSTHSDGKFIYFIWEENLGDIWTMTVASSGRP